MSDYPKVMSRAGAEITVTSASEQGDREADGWKACDGSVVTASVGPDIDARAKADLDAMADGVVNAADDESEGPTFGPPHDDTHAKRSRPGSKKK